MSWSIPIFRAGGIQVRIPITFLLLRAWLMVHAAMPRRRRMQLALA